MTEANIVFKDNWFTIPDFPDYQINALGEIRTSDTHNRVMTIHRPTLGHTVGLWRDGDYLTQSVGDLVTQAFPRLTKPKSETFEADQKQMVAELTEELSYLLMADFRSEYTEAATAVVNRMVKAGWHPDGQC